MKKPKPILWSCEQYTYMCQADTMWIMQAGPRQWWLVIHPLCRDPPTGLRSRVTPSSLHLCWLPPKSMPQCWKSLSCCRFKITSTPWPFASSSISRGLRGWVPQNRPGTISCMYRPRSKWYCTTNGRNEGGIHVSTSAEQDTGVVQQLWQVQDARLTRLEQLEASIVASTAALHCLPPYQTQLLVGHLWMCSDAVFQRAVAAAYALITGHTS